MLKKKAEKKPKEAKKKDKKLKRGGKEGSGSGAIWHLASLDETVYPLVETFVDRCVHWLRTHHGALPPPSPSPIPCRSDMLTSTREGGHLP